MERIKKNLCQQWSEVPKFVKHVVRIIDQLKDCGTKNVRILQGVGLRDTEKMDLRIGYAFLWHRKLQKDDIGSWIETADMCQRMMQMCVCACWGVGGGGLAWGQW